MWAVNFVFHPKILLKFHEVMLIEMFKSGVGTQSKRMMIHVCMNVVWIKRCSGPRSGAMAEGEVKREEGVEGLKRGGWSSALAFFHDMSMEDVKETLGAACANWELEDFEGLRKEAKKQRLALDMEENEAIARPVLSQKDISWVPRTGHAVLRKKEDGIELERARAMLPRMIWPNRLERRLSHAKEDAQREKLEEEERTRQINKLVALLTKAGLMAKESLREGAASAWLKETCDGTESQYPQGAREVRREDVRVQFRKLRSDMVQGHLAGHGLHCRTAGGAMREECARINLCGIEVLGGISRDAAP